MMMHDDEEPELPPTDIEIAAHLATLYIRESIFRSSRATLDVTELITGLCLGWQELRGSVPGIEDLEEGLRLALAVLGASETELDAEGRIVPESHLEAIVNAPTPQPQPRRGLFDTGDGPNNKGLFRA